MRLVTIMRLVFMGCGKGDSEVLTSSSLICTQARFNAGAAQRHTGLSFEAAVEKPDA